jgi:hypothetical protein
MFIDPSERGPNRMRRTRLGKRILDMRMPPVATGCESGSGAL